MEETLIGLISSALKNGSASSILIIIPIALTFIYMIRLNLLEKKYSKGACCGNPKNCVANITKKCMIEYTTREATVKYNASEGYVSDLRSKMADGEVILSEDIYNYTVMRHKTILDAAFLTGKYYVHDLVIDDDFPPTYIKVNDQDTLNPLFKKLSNNCFECYYNIVWDLYAETYQTSLYKLDFQDRRKSYLKNKEKMSLIFLEMMIEFNRIMGKER